MPPFCSYKKRKSVSKSPFYCKDEMHASFEITHVMSELIQFQDQLRQLLNNIISDLGLSASNNNHHQPNYWASCSRLHDYHCFQTSINGEEYLEEENLLLEADNNEYKEPLFGNFQWGACPSRTSATHWHQVSRRRLGPAHLVSYLLERVDKEDLVVPTSSRSQRPGSQAFWGSSNIQYQLYLIIKPIDTNI